LWHQHFVDGRAGLSANLTESTAALYGEG
jgi:hypothetical protein